MDKENVFSTYNGGGRGAALLQPYFYSTKMDWKLWLMFDSTWKNKERRSQDGGGIGRVITVSSTNSLKKQQNGEQSLQNNFWSLAADIRRPEKQPIVFEGR